MGKEAMAKSAAADSFFSSFKFKPGHALATKPADAMKGAQVAKSTAGSETFSSEAGRFTVSMPGRPKEDATTVKTAVGEIKVFNFQVEVDEGVYIVGYSDYPRKKFVRASSPDKMLDGGVNGMMTSSGARC